MDRILLSILTPTVPRRRAMMADLANGLAYQIGDLPVEHLILEDNKRRPIGGKRQALLDIARGEYVAFVDDDDWVADDYVERLLVAIERKPDLIVFPIRVTINGGQDGIVEPSVVYAPRTGEPLAEYKPPVTNRPPHELCCWRRTLAICSRFPDTSVGEEFAWAFPLWQLVRSEVRIDKILYWWRHDISRREHFEVVK